MNQVEFNFLNMTDRTLAFMNANTVLWVNDPEIKEVVNIIVLERTGAGEKGALESGLSGKGHTAAKNNTFDSFVAKTYKLSKKISAYVKTKGLLSLLPMVDLSLSALSRGPEKEVVNRCRAIAEIARTNMTGLATFKVTTDEVELINTLISDYQSHIDNRSTTNISKSSSRDDVAVHISNLRTKLDLLDDLVEGLMDDDAFIRSYKSARAIDDYGKGKTLKNKEKTLA
jgi:hypothetical protein